MDKFENFKKFIKAEMPHGHLMIEFMLEEMNWPTFLALIIKMRGKFQGELNGHTATMAIMEHLHLDPKAFSPASMAKFELYCEYFIEATNPAK